MGKTALVLGAVLLMASLAQASIIDANCANDGDGAINCVATWDPNVSDSSIAGELTIVGNQYWDPGHMLGWFDTDTDEDPNVKVINSIDNETWFAWTGYKVNISMNKTFTLYSAVNYTPGDWTYSITQPSLVGSLYIGSVEYTAGTAVGIGDTLDFGYRMSFIGDIQYCQEMIPIPEPVTMSLLAFGAMGLIGRKRR